MPRIKLTENYRKLEANGSNLFTGNKAIDWERKMAKSMESTQ